MYVHCITQNSKVVTAIKNLPGIEKVSHDNTFNTAVHWAAKDLEKVPDVIFCEEYAVNSTLDKDTGKLNRDKIILEALRDIRFSLSSPIIIILLHDTKKNNQDFLSALVSLAIYDFYFFNESYKLEDLEKMLFSKPRQLRDAAEYVKSIASFNNIIGEEETNSNASMPSGEKNEKQNNLGDRIVQISETLIQLLKKYYKKKQRAEQPPNIQHGWYTYAPEDNQQPNDIDKTGDQDSQGNIVQIKKEIKKVKSLQRHKSNKVKVIAIGSLSVSSGVSSLTAILAHNLSKQGSVAAVDCDLISKGLGVRFGTELPRLEANDWRSKESLLNITPRIKLYPLDPSSEDKTSSERFRKVINEAAFANDWVMLDIGKHMDNWLFQEALKVTDVVFWVIKDDNLMLYQLRDKWKDRPKLECRETIVLFGDGNVLDIESIFILPTLQIKSGKDKKGIYRVMKMLNSMPAEKGIKVTTVGFNGATPYIPGILFDNFLYVEEAKQWLEYNNPEIVIISKALDKGALIEYDLQKRNIPVYWLADISNPEELMSSVNLQEGIASGNGKAKD